MGLFLLRLDGPPWKAIFCWSSLLWAPSTTRRLPGSINQLSGFWPTRISFLVSSTFCLTHSRHVRPLTTRPLSVTTVSSCLHRSTLEPSLHSCILLTLSFSPHLITVHPVLPTWICCSFFRHLPNHKISCSVTSDYPPALEFRRWRSPPPVGPSPWLRAPHRQTVQAGPTAARTHPSPRTRAWGRRAHR